MTTQRLVLAGVAANAAVGPLFAWSLIADDAARDRGMSAGAAAAVFAVSIVVMASAMVVTGRALGKVGPRPLLVWAAAAAGGGLLLAAALPRPVGLWLGFAGLFGGANGVAYSVATTLASWVRVGRRGAATGIVVAAYAGAPVMLGLVGPSLIAEHGWRACTVATGVGSGGLLLLAARLAPARAHEDLGAVAAAAGRAPRVTLMWLWLLFAGSTAPALMVFAHAVALATLRGLDAAAAGVALSVLAGGNLSGRIVAGWFSDLVGRSPSLAVAVAAPAPAISALVWGDRAVLVVGYAVLGFCYGAVSALLPAATADHVGVAAFPRAYAWVFSAWGVAGLVGPVAGAALLGVAAGTPTVLLLAAAPLLPAGLALWALSRSGRTDASGGA